MATEREQLEAGLAALEAQRPVLGDAVVDTSSAPIRARLAALSRNGEPSQRLKQVSILFLDVVGSTTLSQHLDPEATAAVMNRVLEDGTRIVDAHRGRVLQYAGDNLLAVFGVDRSLEDDPERAVRCGLALVALGRTLAAEVLAVHRRDGFDVRVGIHTGGVLLGGGVEANGAVRGLAVNFAARMEQTAPAGTLRISHDTYLHVRGLFDVQPQPPMFVRGVDAPVRSYLVVGPRPKAFRTRARGIDGVATRMIGREAAFDDLKEAFRALFRDRTLIAVTVVGDAGVGKSRLLDEFAAWSDEQPERFTAFQARAHPHMQRQPYGLLRDLVTTRLRVADDDALAVARRKLEEGNPFYMEELVNMLIDRGAIETGDVWTVHADRLHAGQVPGTLTGVLQARLDSLGAAERTTLQEASVIGQVFWDKALFALDRLAEDALPQLVLRALTIPAPGRPEDDSGDGSGDASGEYAFKHALLHQVTYSTVLRAARVALHGKLARWLASQTGLRANDFLAVIAWHFEEAGDTVEAVEFYARAAAQAEQRMAHEAVHANVARGLALLDGPPRLEARPLRWKLIAAREATLNVQGDRAAQLADIHALERLADEGNEADEGGAANDDGYRAYAALRHGFFGMRTADHTTMLEYGRRAASLAASTGDHAVRLRAQRLVAFGLADAGDLDGARRLADAVLEEALALNLSHVAGSCLNALAVIADMQGDLLGALAAAERALVADRATNNLQNEAVNRANVGAGWLLLGDAARVRRESEEGLRLLRANGDRAMECVPLCNLSMVALWDGDAEEAARLARTAVATASAVKAQHLEVIAFLRLGDAEAALGRLDAAGAAYRDAQTRAVEMGVSLRHDAAAGLALTALSATDLPGAMSALASLLTLPGDEAIGQALQGADRPRWIELACYRVLRATGDGRAASWLRRAHDALRTQAAQIGDPAVRSGFLENIPHHREIVAAFEKDDVTRSSSDRRGEAS